MVPTPRTSIRIHPDDKKRWQRCAEAEGLSLTALIERAMNRECERIEKR